MVILPQFAKAVFSSESWWRFTRMQSSLNAVFLAASFIAVLACNGCDSRCYFKFADFLGRECYRA